MDIVVCEISFVPFFIHALLVAKWHSNVINCQLWIRATNIVNKHNNEKLVCILNLPKQELYKVPFYQAVTQNVKLHIYFFPQITLEQLVLSTKKTAVKGIRTKTLGKSYI